MRTVLKRPDFRLLLGGLFFSMSAESILLLALAIWAKDLTGSDGMAGAAILAVIAPMALASMIGFVVDRFRRKPFLVVTLLISALGPSPLLLVVDRDDLWILFAVAVGYGLSFISVSAALNGGTPGKLEETRNAATTYRIWHGGNGASFRVPRPLTQL
jgi:MFS family permease